MERAEGHESGVVREEGVEEGVLFYLLIYEETHRHQVGEEAKAKNYFGNEKLGCWDIHEHICWDGVYVKQPEKK